MDVSLRFVRRKEVSLMSIKQKGQGGRRLDKNRITLRKG